MRLAFAGACASRPDRCHLLRALILPTRLLAVIVERTAMQRHRPAWRRWPIRQRTHRVPAEQDRMP
ncbi:MAG: hypothetical protein C0521_05595 [Xanthomonas sp.]|nr:hypothetical protein [Xanthomonas sp.]